MTAQRSAAGAGLSIVIALIGGALAPPALASEVSDDPSEVSSEISPEVEAAKVAEALDEAAESSGEEEVATVAAYDLRVSDEDDDADASAGLRTSFPIPDRCDADTGAGVLNCATGTVVLEPSVLTLDGVPINYDVAVSDTEILVSAAPADSLTGPFLFSLYVGDSSESETLADATEALEWMLSAGPEADLSDEELAAEEAELEEALGEGDGDADDAAADEEAEVAPAVFSVGQATAGQASVVPAAAFKRPSKVGIPSGYVYCKIWVTAKCKPKNLHDYCSWSPDSYTYKGTKVDYRGPCARHDMSIDSIRKKNISVSNKRSQRASADTKFKSNLRQNCGYSLYKTSAGRSKCYDRAALYYSVVRKVTKTWDGK